MSETRGQMSRKHTKGKILCLLTSVFCLLTSGCGFHPLYGSRDGNSSVSAELNDVAIDNIADRNGQILRNDLIDRMYHNGRPQSPKYTLTTSLRTLEEGIGLLPDATTSLTELNLYADYTLKDQAGKTANLIVSRNGTTVPLQITPQFTDIGDGTKGYRLGFGYLRPPVKVERLPFGQAFTESVKFNKKGSLFIVEVLKRLFTHQVSVKSLQSPIGIGQQIHEAYEQPGWTPLIGTMSLISLNLGIFNLLPIPILDGGMILFLIIETIMRRDVNQQIKERIYQVAFVCILAFFAFVIFNDLTRLNIFSKLKP